MHFREKNCDKNRSKLSLLNSNGFLEFGFNFFPDGTDFSIFINISHSMRPCRIDVYKMKASDSFELWNFIWAINVKIALVILFHNLCSLKCPSIIKLTFLNHFMWLEIVPLSFFKTVQRKENCRNSLINLILLNWFLREFSHVIGLT